MAIREKVFDMPCRGVDLTPRKSQHATTGAITLLGSRLLPRIGVTLSEVLGEWYAGCSDNNYFRDISGNGRHLTGTNGPTFADSTLVGWDGNPIKSYSFTAASSQMFSLAHDTWMDCYSSNFSISILVKSPTSAPGADQMFFSHGGGSVDGCYLRMATTGYYGAVLSKSGASVVPNYPASAADGCYHLLHVVGNSDFTTVYLDGVPGAPVDSSGYGVAGSRIFYIGCTTGPNYYWNSHVSYVRLQNTALAYHQIQKEVAAFQGILASRGGGRSVVPYFTRASTTPVNRRAGYTSQAMVPTNWPARSHDQALRIEASKSSATNGNLATYTGAFSTNWTKTNTDSIAATSVTLPDGSTSTTATFHEDATAGAEHKLSHTFSATSGTSYCWALSLKYNGAAAVPRPWMRLQVSDGTNNKTIHHNIQTGATGTASGSLTGGYNLELSNDGWYRGHVWATAGATATGTFSLSVCDGDNDVTVDGQNQDSVFIAWPQLETGAFPTSYLARPTDAAVTRAADFCTVLPYNLNKELAGCVAATPRLLFNGTESLNGATVTPTVGAYSFTKNGRPQQGFSDAEGYHQIYNGTTDSLTISNSDFTTAGNFSVVLTYTPQTATGVAHLMARTAASPNLGWTLSQSGSSVLFQRSTGGTTHNRACTVSSCLEIGKPVLITASFSTATGMTLYVDAFTAVTDLVLTANYTGTNDIYIGSGISTYYLNGRIHYLAYYDNYVVSASEHAAMYAKFKVDGILPLTMSASTVKTKITMEWEAKTQYSGGTDIGASGRNTVAINGLYGGSSATKNGITPYMGGGNGVLYAQFYGNDEVSRLTRTGHDLSPQNKWRKYIHTVDLAEMNNGILTVDGTNERDSNTDYSGAQTINFHDCQFRIGNASNGGVTAACEYRNIKIYLE